MFEVIELDAKDGESERDGEIMDLIEPIAESDDASACCWHAGIALPLRDGSAARVRRYSE